MCLGLCDLVFGPDLPDQVGGSQLAHLVCRLLYYR